MSSREQFEETMCNQYSWFRETLDLAQFHGDDITGYYTGGDYMYHGNSCADALFWAWRGWQESHKQGEAKCAALAAENAALKAAFSPEEIPEDAVEAFTDTAIMDYDCDDTGSWSWVENDTDVIRAVLAAMAAPETPATDAFLAEVRAQGVEMVIAYHRERADALPNIDRNNAIRHSMAALDASDIAAQLRQEASK